MEEQLINNSILDQFINSHEQSYEEFLSTFTYLSKDLQKFSASGENKTTSFVQIQSKDVVLIYLSASAEFLQNAVAHKTLGLLSFFWGLGLLFHLIDFTDRKFFLIILIAVFSGFVVVTVEFLKSKIEKLPAEIYGLDKDGLIIAWNDQSGVQDGHWLMQEYYVYSEPTEEEGKTIQGCKKSLRKSFSTSEFSNGDKQGDLPRRSKEMLLSLPPQMPNENEIVMNESWKSGGSDGNGLSLSERAKVDNYIEIDMDEKTCSAGSLVLPGEVEEIITCYTPVEKRVQRKFRTFSVQQPLNNKAQELLGDDVQPFLLDEEFDYDNVALTPKFSEAELMAITELSEEKKSGQMSSPAGAEV